jgi:hypothetical protein
MRALHGARRIRWATLMCAFALAVVPGPARAADAVIDGSPLNIYANDNGQLQVAFDGSATGEFFPGSLSPANAGLHVAVAQSGQPFDVRGFLTRAFDPTTPAAPPVVTGDGSPGNPWKLTTSYEVLTPSPTGVQIDEVLTYVNGTTDVAAQYTVTNNSDVTQNVFLYEAADLYVAGNDAGAGFFVPGPPRQLGGINEAQGSSGGLVEQTPWSHYQEGRYSDVFSVVSSTNATTTAQSFSDTVDPTLLDDGLGAQWNLPGVPTGTTNAKTVSVVWRFKHFTPLTLSLAAVARSQGQIATVNVAARNSDGNPDPGRAIRFTISGANPGLGTVTTGADGNATISWLGENRGVDTLTAFADLNGNGTLDAGEPAQSVAVTWAPPLPPVPGKSVVVKVVSGTVFVKYPPGYTPRATSLAKGFVPFKGAANLPVGTQLDTRKGRVNLTSAADTGGKKTQASDFYDGIFQVKQALPKKTSKKAVALTTDVVMKGQLPRSGCAPLKGASAAALDAKKKKKGPKSVLGKLWGNGKGKFRTTGKYSSATVRGTIWLVEDRCDGTLTKVARGVVSVRDIKRKKTVKVKAGHSYLARAQRATSKTKRQG